MPSHAISEDVLVREFTRELHNHNAAVFVGAGLSMSAGYVDWKGLLRQIIEDLQLDPDEETDLVTLAQYHCNGSGGRGTLSQVVFDKFRELRSPTKNHELLAKMPIQTYWTTNYDKLIETALEKANKVADVKYTAKQLAVTRLDRDVYVNKMHGDIDHPADAVLTKDDYEKYSMHMSPFVSALRGDLIEKTFLFLGFSFTDPNIDYILSRVRVVYESNQRVHYCVQRRVSQGDSETEKAFRRRELKQEYFIADLKRFGVHTVLVEDYQSITQILERIFRSFRRSSVLISGAAHEYGAFREAPSFLHKLSFALASKRNRIISGFGVGVGDAVINGVISHLNATGKSISDEDLMLRPFPQISTTASTLQEEWESYRRSMIENAGIAVFVFGNKLDVKNNSVVASDGMKQEFEICKEHGVVPLPIGASGYVAKEIWSTVNNDFDSFFPNATASLKGNFEILGDLSAASETLVEAVLAIVDELKRD